MDLPFCLGIGSSLRRFEADLQRISGDPDLGIPYWDWENDNTFPAFLGGDGVLLRARGQEPMAYFMAVDEEPFRFNQGVPTAGWFAVDGNGLLVGPLQRAFGTEKVPQWAPNTGQVIRDPQTGQAALVPVTLPTFQEVQHALGYRRVRRRALE